MGKSDAQLQQRLDSKATLKATSTFKNEAEANSFISRTLEQRAIGLQNFLNGKAEEIQLHGQFGSEVTGRTLVRGASAATDSHKVLVQIVRDPSRANGYNILTAHPF